MKKLLKNIICDIGDFNSLSHNVQFYKSNRADIKRVLLNRSIKEEIAICDMVASYNDMKGVYEPYQIERVLIGDERGEDAEIIMSALCRHAVEYLTENDNSIEK